MKLPPLPEPWQSKDATVVLGQFDLFNGVQMRAYADAAIEPYRKNESALRELIADAERYRWLRNVAPFWSAPTPQVMTTLFDNGHFQGYTPTQDMDTAIDAARATAAPPLPTSEQA